VNNVDALAEYLPPGDDVAPLSIDAPLPAGMHGDGTYVTLPLNCKPGSIVGDTPNGRAAHPASGVLQPYSRTHTVAFGVHLSGGEAFRPFRRPWLEGKATKPAIDWVATTPKDAELLLDFLLGAIAARSAGYADLLAEVNDDKVPSSPAIPHLELVTDEAADLPREIKDKIVELSNRSRGVSIRPLTCALRAVSAGGEQLPKPLLAQAGVRTAMKVNEDAELNHMYGYSRGLPKADEMPSAGYGLAQVDPSQAPRIFKGLLVKPTDSARVAVATDERRPVLDEV